MLVALKTNVYPKELLTDFIDTLKIVVKYNFTTEVIRSIVTFLVSTLNKRGFCIFNIIYTSFNYCF